MIIRKPKQGAIGLNLTSMIDVVFLLLIYFLVATEFQTSEAAFPMDLPDRSHGHILMIDDEPIVIVIESYGSTSQDLQLHVKEPWGPVRSIEALQLFLHSNLSDGFGTQGLFTDDHPIRLIPTKTTRWDHVLTVYNTVVEMEYTNIILDDPT